MPNSGCSKQILFYADEAGNEPFAEWLESLRDLMGRKRTLTRLRRLEQGNYGDYKSLQGGVCELRLFFGPGYRVYFGEGGDTLGAEYICSSTVAFAAYEFQSFT